MCKNAYTVYFISYIVYVYNILPNKNNSKMIFNFIDPKGFTKFFHAKNDYVFFIEK